MPATKNKSKKKPRIVWRCKFCKSLQISDPYEHHTMDYCKCEKTAIDLELEYCRVVGEQPIMWEEVFTG